MKFLILGKDRQKHIYTRFCTEPAIYIDPLKYGMGGYPRVGDRLEHYSYNNPDDLLLVSSVASFKSLS